MCRTFLQFKVIGDDAVISDIKKQKTVGIFIVGETARADRFSLNGYKKLTNPRLIFLFSTRAQAPLQVELLSNQKTLTPALCKISNTLDWLSAFCGE
jgi:glucan phosphoethanolaminetransferase (alkaline phosphatase superfamily)